MKGSADVILCGLKTANWAGKKDKGLEEQIREGERDGGSWRERKKHGDWEVEDMCEFGLH